MNTGLSFTPGSDNWAMNSLEVGWQVYSDLYGDMLPRLFVYWTVSVKTLKFSMLELCVLSLHFRSNVLLVVYKSN